MRTLLRRLLIAMLLGALTTVAVAWALVVAPDRRPRIFGFGLGMDSSLGGPRLFMMVVVERRAGHDSVTLDAMGKPFDARRNAAVAEAMASRTKHAAAHPEEPDPPSWAWVLLPHPNDAPAIHWATRAAGWPWPCLRSCTFTAAADGVPKLRYALPLPAWLDFEGSRNDPHCASLPLLPHGPGFAANTGVFAVPWAVLLFGVPAFRARRRRRRGRCISCGYDLRGAAGAACPECGAGRVATVFEPKG